MSVFSINFLFLVLQWDNRYRLQLLSNKRTQCVMINQLTNNVNHEMQILIWQKTENTVTDISHARTGPRREDRKLTTVFNSA